MSAVHFTSDTHYGHANVIRYSRRPFADADEMDAALVANWRRCVAPGDRVYVLGDFSFHKPGRTIEILSQLPGQKYLITGNHCRVDGERWAEVRRRFEWVRPFEEIKIEGQRITLCHYALRTWNRSHKGAWSLYGHSHGSLPDDPHALSMDVGVDAVAARLADDKPQNATMGPPHLDAEDYRPIRFDEVAAIMARKKWRPIDHHGDDGDRE